VGARRGRVVGRVAEGRTCAGTTRGNRTSEISPAPKFPEIRLKCARISGDRLHELPEAPLEIFLGSYSTVSYAFCRARTQPGMLDNDDRAQCIPLSPPCVCYATILAITIFQTSYVDNGAFVFICVSRCSREIAVLLVHGRLWHSWRMRKRFEQRTTVA
jgi:hypothetical protein